MYVMYKIHNKRRRRFAMLRYDADYRPITIYRMLVNRFSTDLFSF